MKGGTRAPPLSVNLFVYGTLRADVAELAQQAAARGALGIMKEGERIGRGSVAGRLFDVGRYPAMLPAQGARPVVRGEVWRLKRGALAGLDAYEGSDYRRTLVDVTMEDGSRLEAFAYLWLRGMIGLRPILSGDYLDLAKQRVRG